MAVPVLRGDLVSQLRQGAGLTQLQLAVALGVAAKTRISRWELGAEQPQTRYLPGLSKALGVPALHLLDVDPADPPLAAWRASRGLTVADMVEATGLPHTSYLRLEQGELQSAPPDRVVKALASALRLSASTVRAAVERSRSDHAAAALAASR